MGGGLHCAARLAASALGGDLSFTSVPIIVDTMTTAKTKTATRRSQPAAERTVVYHGVKIPPIAGKRSPLSATLREALFARARIDPDEPDGRASV